MSTQSSGLSRQKIQPRKLAFRNRVAMSWFVLLRDPVLAHEDPVLERARSEIRHLEDVELVLRVQLARVRVLDLEHLRELVVGHRGGRIHLSAQEEVHVERLRDDLDVLLRIEAVLRERREQLVLVPAEPDPDLLALELRDLVEAAVLPRHLGHPRAGEDLRDVDEVLPLVTGREQAVEPVDAELGLSAEDDLLGDDVRPAGPDRDVEALVLVETLVDGGVVAGELRLDDPLALEGDRCQLLRSAWCVVGGLVVPSAAAHHGHRCRDERESCEERPLPLLHLVLSLRRSVQPYSCLAPRIDGCQPMVRRSTKATEP